jgi:pimeloyl-ACP methyl ester carboxylesterase
MRHWRSLAFFGLIVLGLVWHIPQAQALNDLPDDYDGWERKYEYINIDTTWHKDDDLTFHKPVFIDQGAILTIEAGAKVYLDGGDFEVNAGVVHAEGNISQPILFSSHNGKTFHILLKDSRLWFESEDTLASNFSFVRFDGGGDTHGPTPCPMMTQIRPLRSFIPSALAADDDWAVKCLYGTATIVYSSGQVFFDYVSFEHSVFADVDIAGGGFFGERNVFRMTQSNLDDSPYAIAVRNLTPACLFVGCGEDIDLRNNWWGSNRSPIITLETNLFTPYTDEVHHIVADNLYDAVAQTATMDFAHQPFNTGTLCLENCFSNVLFLPGIEASRLYAKDDPNCRVVNCENQLWEPNRNDDVRKLYLDQNSHSTTAYDIYTRDIIDEAGGVGQNIYQSFIEAMDHLKNNRHLINDWAAVPYDWRMSVEQVASGGAVTSDGVSYVQPSNTSHLINELHRLARTSRTGKVTIIAHSNGGLVAKELMRELGDEKSANFIDEVVLVAVPQVGTPFTIAALLHGYKQGYFGGLILSDSVARGLMEFMPSGFVLLPSLEYFATVATPVVSFDTAKLPEWVERFGKTITSSDALRKFLVDDYNRVSAESSNTEALSLVRGTLVDDAATTHQHLDAWHIPAGIRAIQLAGWGVPVTVSGLRYTTAPKIVCEPRRCTKIGETPVAEPLLTEDGDGTVVAPSALSMEDAERVWVNLGSFNDNNPLTTFSIGYFSVSHANIFEIPSLNQYLIDTILHRDEPLSHYPYLSDQKPLSQDSTSTRLQYTLHSPLSLDLYDEDGHHTGLTKDGVIEEGIAGTYYRQFGEVKYLINTSGKRHHLVMRGYDDGQFTLEVESLNHDVSTDKVAFADMPTTKQTIASFDLKDDLKTAQTLVIDTDGDQKTDYTFEAAPNTEVSFAGDIAPTESLYREGFEATLTTSSPASKRHHASSSKKQSKPTLSKRELKARAKHEASTPRKQALIRQVNATTSAPASLPKPAEVAGESIEKNPSPEPQVEDTPIDAVTPDEASASHWWERAFAWLHSFF